MLPQNNPNRVRIAFDDGRLVGHAGLLRPASRPASTGPVAPRPRQYPRAGQRRRQDNDAGGLITDGLRIGSTARDLGRTGMEPSTPGTFLRNFRWGHVLSLDRVSGELLDRAWAAGAGSDDTPPTANLDSTNPYRTTPRWFLSGFKRQWSRLGRLITSPP